MFKRNNDSRGNVGSMGIIVLKPTVFPELTVLPPIKNGPTLAIEMDPPRSCMFLSLGGDNTGLETLLCWVDVVM